jgi:hypothetical protein
LRLLFFIFAASFSLSHKRGFACFFMPATATPTMRRLAFRQFIIGGGGQTPRRFLFFGG